MRSLIGFFLLPLVLFSQNLDYSVVTIPEGLIKGANAVVRLDAQQVLIKDIDHLEWTSKRVVTVLNQKGARFVNAYCRYDNHSKINHLSAVVYDRYGRQIEKFKARDFIDQSAVSSGTLYSDDRVKYLRYTPISYPYTVVYEESYETTDTAFMPVRYFLDDYELSVENSSFSLQVEFDSPIRVKEQNLEAFGVAVQKTDKAFNYAVSHIKPIKREPFSPSFSEIAPNVRFSLESFHLKGVNGTARTWKDFGQWIYRDLLTGQQELSPEIKSKASSLVQGIDDPKTKVEKIYEYLQNNTRYISVQLEIGGWKPISAQEVDRVKYGDCKGLTNYTMALLKEVGVDSYYTILYAGYEKRNLDPEFPGLAGNHAFLNVPLEDDELWLECTSQDTPMNFLSTFSDDRYVLKVTPEGGEMVKSKAYSSEESSQHTEAAIVINDNGQMEAQVTIRSKGTQYDSNDRDRLPQKKAVDIEAYYKEYWDYVTGIDLVKTDFENDKRAIEFTEKVSVTSDHYISKAGEQWLLAPNVFNRNTYVPKRVRTRTQDVVIKRGYVDEDHFTIQLPQQLKIEQLLPKTTFTTDFGTYHLEMEQSGENEITYHRKLTILPGVFPKEKYNEFRAFRKKIAKNDNAKIILTKTEP
ncbi:MAG: DUF3857 and transglutaminase domain-containing protein [Bacteroidota bacterium]